MSNGNMDDGETRPPRDPSLHLLYTERARHLQTQVILDGSIALGRFLVRCLSNGIQGVVNAVQVRRTVTELARLEDHTLSDIGVERARIPEIARALVARRDVAPRIVAAAAPRSPSDRGDAANDDGSHPMAA